MTATYNGTSKQATVTVDPLLLSSISASPATVAASPLRGPRLTIKLGGAAPFGGARVTLSSSNPTALPVPTTYTVPAGMTESSFSAFVGTVNSPTFVTITASYNGSSAQTTVNILLLPTLTLTPSASNITSTQPLTVALEVSGVNGNPQPTGTVTLSSGSYNSPASALSSGAAKITIPAGSLAVGRDQLNANYSGDGNYIGVGGGAVFVAVNPTPLQFIPVTPCRVADSRNPSGPFGGPELTAAATRNFSIPQSACGIPSTAVAYSLNVTVVPSGSLNYLTLWPTGQAQPFVSTLNSDGRVKANAAITPAGTNGGVSVFVSDPTQVILDIGGYFVPAGTASALAFYPVSPCRVADTRGATGPLGGPSISAGTSRAFPVQSSNCQIPSNALAYSLNVTAVPRKTLNYLTSWPKGQSQSNVSTLNSSTGSVTANAAIVPAGTSGNVSIFVSDAADVILDVNGYFAPPATGGLSLYTVTPCRVIDTRSGAGAFNGVLPVSVEGSTCAPPSTAQGYVLNATVVPPAALNYLTLWPDGAAQPNVSTLNADDGAITSNMAIVPTNSGRIDAFSSNSTNLILDISSYFAP